MGKLQKNIWLLVSVGATVFFVLTFLLYIENSPLPKWGPWLLLLLSGVVILALGTALVFSAINLWKYKFHWQGLLTIILSVIALIPIGYVFQVWVIIMIASAL